MSVLVGKERINSFFLSFPLMARFTLAGSKYLYRNFCQRYFESHIFFLSSDGNYFFVILKVKPLKNISLLEFITFSLSLEISIVIPLPAHMLMCCTALNYIIGFL